MRPGGSSTRSPPFRRLVAADDGLRVARFAERTGWPLFSDDPVIDWIVREALVRRLGVVEQGEREKHELEARVKAAEQAAIEKARQGIQ